MRFPGSANVFATVLVLTALGSVASLTACKPRVNKAGLRDDTAVPAGKTAEHLKDLSMRAASGQWRFEINKEAVNNDIGDNKIRSGEDFFGAPYKEIQVCPDDMKVQIGGSPACVVFDNLTTYDYYTNKNLAKGFVNLIPQKLGIDQPEMLKVMQDGDIIVYFHPEYRGGSIDNDSMQWRASHAATIVLKDGSIATADTPAGYAQPFTGADTTPFHVYRFMPKDANSVDMPDVTAQKYRNMLAKWATLGFDQFRFTGAYDSAAGRLTSTDPRRNIGKFADFYIRSAVEGPQTGFPQMYCAWFVYTNLSLAWMYPLNAAGLDGVPSASLVEPNGTFGKIKRGFQFGGNPAMSNYIDDDPALIARSDYPFKPLSANELIRAFLNRLVGDDETSDPMVFVGRAMNKAGILAGLASDGGIKSTFEPRTGYVPEYDAANAERINREIPATIAKFATLYSESAAKVQAEGMDGLTKAKSNLRAAYKAATDEKETDGNFQNTKRWIPPYAFSYIANNFDTRGKVVDENGSTGTRPVLAYIGTVLPEKYLKASGSAGGVGALVVLPSTAPTAADKKLDRDMYAALGLPPKNDLRGYREFFECLANEARPNCGTKIKQRFTKAEADALLIMAYEWKEGARISEKSALVRNDYGLDATLFRRLLASYWNNPGDSIRPNLLEDPSRAIKNSVLNFRIMMASPIDLHAEQGVDDAGGLATRRTTAMPCMTGAGNDASGSPLTCSRFVKTTGARVTLPPNDSQEGWHHQWIQRRTP